MTLRRQKNVRRNCVAFAYAGLIASAASITGCSVYVEATRPTPVDLAQFHADESRDQVVETIGTPTGTTNESDGDSCDSYQLYTHGYGSGGKAGLAVLEGAADVFTLGIAEAVTTPVEGATKNEKYPVLFCYKDGKLARLSESGKPLITSEPAAETAQANPSGATQTASVAQSGTDKAPSPPTSPGAVVGVPTQAAVVAKVAAPAATAPASATAASSTAPSPAPASAGSSTLSVKPAIDWQPAAPATE